MKRILPAAAAVFCASLAPAYGMTAAPAAFPMLDKATMTVSLIVASVGIPGTVKLPRPQDCFNGDQKLSRVDAVRGQPCMDAPPYAFKASDTIAVYGASLPSALYISTTSAQGVRNFNLGNPVSLMLVFSDGQHAVMPRNARGRVWTDRAGEHFLVVDGKHAPAFLPCSVSTLMEELRHETIVPGQYGSMGTPFPEDWNAPGERVSYLGSLQPRYAIRMSRLKTHLAAIQPGPADMACERPQA